MKDKKCNKMFTNDRKGGYEPIYCSNACRHNKMKCYIYPTNCRF